MGVGPRISRDVTTWSKPHTAVLEAWLQALYTQPDLTAVFDTMGGSVLSNSISVLSQSVSVISVKLDTLSNQVSVLSQAVSVLSQQVSVLSQAMSVLSNAVSVLSQQASILSQQVSVLSNQVSVLSNQVSVISQQLSVLSQAVSVISNKLSAVGAWAVRGLSGLVSGSSTVNLAANAVCFFNPTNNGIIAFTSAVSVTNNVGTSADQANGRDQVGAFTSSIWLHVYFVLDGTTVKSRSSTGAPPTGPTLQGTEKAWAYAGAVRRNALNNLVATQLRGAAMFYNVGQNAVTGGTASAETSVALATFVPPNALMYTSRVQTEQTVAAATTLRLRHTAGSDYLSVVITTAAQNDALVVTFPNTATQDMFYSWTVSPTGGLTMDVLGYCVPNGGE